jgi:crotonobetainyl-CoA:carnitine CoA-transferase CaiB-like acyl-CoA transferase
MGNRHPQIAPYEAVQGKDGDWFILGVGSDNVWQSFCHLVERPDLATDPRFAENAQRVFHYDALMPSVRDIVKQRTVDDWLPALRNAGVPAGRINTIDQALSDEHLLERGMIVEFDHPALGLLKSIATPIHLSDTPLMYRLPPPRLGEHTDSVLSEMGYDQGRIQALHAQGIIA